MQLSAKERLKGMPHIKTLEAAAIFFVVTAVAVILDPPYLVLRRNTSSGS